MKAGLFITCLADVMRPGVAAAAMSLMRRAGAEVVCPPRQTCCGQIAYNGGYFEEAAALAEQCADLFADCDAVVFPSASCCGVFRIHWREIFGGDNAKMRAFAGKCKELSEFLTMTDCEPPTIAPLRATYHDCCAGLRELGVKHAPRDLLRRAGAEIVEMRDCEECCGFGGAFAAKFGDVSAAMADRKLACAAAAGVDTVILGEAGCILHLEGRALRLQKPVRFLHWAEALAGENC